MAITELLPRVRIKRAKLIEFINLYNEHVLRAFHMYGTVPHEKAVDWFICNSHPSATSDVRNHHIKQWLKNGFTVIIPGERAKLPARSRWNMATVGKNEAYAEMLIPADLLEHDPASQALSGD